MIHVESLRKKTAGPDVRRANRMYGTMDVLCVAIDVYVMRSDATELN